MRDATVVLDEILDNETELPLFTHSADTAGYTEIVFGLFDLLGLQFAPRIRDLGDQCLYRLKEGKDHGAVNDLLTGKLNFEPRDQRRRGLEHSLYVRGDRAVEERRQTD